MTVQTSAATIDVRAIAPQERHALIFARFGGLVANEALELVNDHDPRPLQQQFQARWPGRFSWDDLDTGPALWRVRITKRAGHSDGQCCGACGGT